MSETRKMTLELSPSMAEDAAAELVNDMTEVVRTKVGFKESLAVIIASQIVEGLRERYPAQQLYIPAPSKNDRDDAIRAAFTGRNHRDVMRDFGITKSTLYRVLKIKAEQ